MPCSRSAVGEDVFAVAASVHEGVCKNRHPVEGEIGVDAASQCENVRCAPHGIEFDLLVVIVRGAIPFHSGSDVSEPARIGYRDQDCGLGFLQGVPFVGSQYS